MVPITILNYIKNKMKHYLLFIAFIIFCSCDPMDDRLVFKNSTNDKIVVRLMFDKELPNNPEHWNRSRNFTINPFEEKKLSIFNQWEGEFKRALPNKAINVLVTKYYDFETNPNKWDTLYSKGSYFKSKFTLEEIKTNDWMIIYPNNKFKKGESYMLKK